MLRPLESDFFESYGFNPYQFSLSDDLMLDFHRRHVSYFVGCAKVLDLGAGRGFFLRALRERGIAGLGVENYPRSIAAGEKFGVEYIKADIFEFLRSNESRKIVRQCDGVYCCHVIEHLEPAEVFELFRRVKENCAPNVRCRFITNNPADIDVLGYNFWMDLTHRRLYPSKLLIAMANSQGFTMATAKPFRGTRLNLFGQILWLLRRLRWGRHKGMLDLLLDCS
jgi:2-polyprenyl-3-methyl-5-hydroxy-6-metoxy-1,4-benzoquinol methylase